MERAERLKMVITHLRGAYSTFAVKCGINPSNLKKMLEGNLTITDRTLYRIVDTFPQINIEWLRTGEGEMLRPVTGQAASSSEDKDESFINLKREIDALKKELSLKDDLIASQRETIESQRDRINDLVNRRSSSDASLH